MRRRIVTSTALIALASVIVLGVPLGIVEAKRLRSEAGARLEREADGVARAIDDRLEAHQPITAPLVARYVRSGDRVVITTGSGRTITSGTPIQGRVMRARSAVAQGAVVMAEEPAADAATRVRHEWLLIAALAFGGVAAAVLLALVQARRLARPLESLAETSARLGEGDFSTRAGRFPVPEVDALARVLDRSAVRIARLVAREREFSANASHQLRTPLTALRLRLEELAPSTDPEAQAEIDAALDEVDRLEGTIANLLAYARKARAGDVVDLDLADLTRRHANTWAVLFQRAGRPLEVEAGAPITVTASPGALGQVLDVLLDNALHHGAGRTRVSVADGGKRATVAVEDEGAGIDAGAEREIFERGASEGGGTGIGLHLARVLAVAEGGRLVLTRPAPPRFELLVPHRPRDPAEKS